MYHVVLGRERKIAANRPVLRVPRVGRPAHLPCNPNRVLAFDDRHDYGRGRHEFHKFLEEWLSLQVGVMLLKKGRSQDEHLDAGNQESPSLEPSQDLAAKSPLHAVRLQYYE